MMGRGAIHTEHMPLGRLYLGVTYSELKKELVYKEELKACSSWKQPSEKRSDPELSFLVF
jgi:hypothetical protein